MTRTQVKLEPGSGASDDRVDGGHGPISTHPQTRPDCVTLTIQTTLDRSSEVKSSSLLTNCGAGFVTRTQVKLEPGSGTSNHRVDGGHGPKSTH